MSLQQDGADLFPATPASRRWAIAARTRADAILSSPSALQDQDLRHGKTWLVGLDALANDPAGAVDGVPFTGPWASHLPPAMPLHRAQLSVAFPGYPKQDPHQSDANHRFRVQRCAAHMDGLLPEGPNNRRYAREFHAYILGIALTDSSGAPTVYWKGSHQILQDAFAAHCTVDTLTDTDVTELYSETRRRVFERCECVPLPMTTGQSVLLHRFTLHGTAPWNSADTTPRIHAFFRPEMRNRALWLSAP